LLSTRTRGWTEPLHATCVLAACGLSLILHSPAPWIACVGASFVGFVLASADRWTADGSFGIANVVTSLRLTLVLGLLGAARYLSDLMLASGMAVAFALDALDGRLARRFGRASPFGALFDMEVDAAFVLALGYLLVSRAGLGLWVLIPGSLRYAYVLCVGLFVPSGVQDRRSQLGRIAFLVSTSLLLLSFLMPAPWRTWFAFGATLVTSASFARSFALGYPQVWASVRRLATSPRAALPTLVFVACWSFLNLVVNLRYPAPEPSGWYFFPSLDVSIVLAVLAVIGLLHVRLAWWMRVPVLIVFIVVRTLRIGDGITGVYFDRLFTLYTDLPLLPDLLRYARATYSRATFLAGLALAVLAVLIFVIAVDRALAYSAAFLSRSKHIITFTLLVLPFAVASIFATHDTRYNKRYAGAFAASVLPRLHREARFLLNVYDRRSDEAEAIAKVQRELRQTPSDLSRLHRANVYLFFVESYGATVLDRTTLRQQVVPALQASELALAHNGFSMASGLVDSATYGGMSWLAHATFLTGVRTTDQLQYDLLALAHPRSMARILRDAGYRAILVEPNTERRSPVGDAYGFDTTYGAWDFDYAGPAFAWATMPDQYVLDYIRRKVVDKQPAPLFMTYVLVSSHAPWSHVPTLVADWSRIGNGRLYHTLPFHRAYTNWPDFSNASAPYARSIVYDLDVLTHYMTTFVSDDALMIVLGDHQPVSELTDGSQSWAVPIHVISRDSAFVERFLAHGYVRGMVPGTSPSPMQDFLLTFLRDFSGGSDNARVN